MACPKDKEFLEKIIHHSEVEVPPPPAAKVLGILSLIGTVFLLALFWFHKLGIEYGREFGFIIIVAALSVIHTCGIFSQILSAGQNKLGGISILALYAGMILNVIIAHLLG